MSLDAWPLTRAVGLTVARSATTPPTGLQSLITVLYEPLARNVSAETTSGARERGPTAIDTFVEIATRPVSPFSQMLILADRGAIARVDENATAFGQRTAPFDTHYLSMWEDPAETERNVAYTREIATAMKPWTTGRVYLNFIGEEGPGRVEAAFGPEKFTRLQTLKDKWDPTNLFLHNQNIPPSAEALATADPESS